MRFHIVREQIVEELRTGEGFVMHGCDESLCLQFEVQNLASFVSSIFGSQEIGFADLNDHFLDVFVPEGGRPGTDCRGAAYG
jgi:hypothetical protein